MPPGLLLHTKAFGRHFDHFDVQSLLTQLLHLNHCNEMFSVNKRFWKLYLNTKIYCWTQFIVSPQVN